MYDNKVRLSKDVIDKAEQIAAEWGLKNARAAIEAVFRKYADEYRYGRSVPVSQQAIPVSQQAIGPAIEVPFSAGLGEK